MSLTKVKTALGLGLPNLIRVFVYQVGVKTGFNKVKTISSEIEQGAFFSDYQGTTVNLKNNEQWLGCHTYFGKVSSNSAIPNWHQNCLNNSIAPSDKPWYQISDFDQSLGDIKGIWEASRFDWVIAFAQQLAGGDKKGLIKLNTWLSDWVEKNPTYNGVNWKCGQEASFRVMHLALATVLLSQTERTTPALLSLIKAHLKRISPTIMYAIAQDNNHGTSEAAALYIGGSWLMLSGDESGIRWQKQGLKWLENRAHKLIEADGSFSQYSVNYHRVMLDTYSLVEVWRQKYKLAPFSDRLYKKLKAATDWLYHFTDCQTGDAPNIGANDGARLIPLTSCSFRDFRPSVQLASALFLHKSAYSYEGKFNIPLRWLGLEVPLQKLKDKISKDFPCGGYGYLANGEAAVYFNYPKFKFRPSQCDVLHIDFWFKGKNIFRDGGTFSYNAGQKYIDYYGGVKSHNTIEFDTHEQMPRLSRFLLGDWLKVSNKTDLLVSGNSHRISAGYKDRFGCHHDREIKLESNLLIIKDSIAGFKNNAVLRFRLAPASWQLLGHTLTSELCDIRISANVSFDRVEIVKGYESRYYYHESQIPVLEVELSTPGIVTTEISF